MAILELLTISIALALDACGVAFSLGIKKNVERNHAKLYIFSFAIFQSLFAFIGGFCGYAFNKYILTIPQSSGGYALLIIGTFLLLGLFDKNESINITKWYMIIGMGISVSIDALLIGFSLFNAMDTYTLLFNSAIVGVITAIMSALTFVFSRYIKKLSFIQTKNDLISGCILIVIGFKMILC